ncbi:Autoinducer 2 sensor kinase/phosphatase LuxQ [Fundidesulfovibrio magnetotacticus]|uniref:histidine kinase n=1 Tax=Fundidesulfovibrio magnetotacticus TaxID=2730080 RepID=A0A6V8LZF7_9BACT|nr:HAMP domain-containing sensor histidine kinase [Fundidesulfovibrio magnetotacticus]GFK95399.1 Autoinducer 2 sensor kinase/phosphatase LuxQ [Fundidesulfovibrio magnetotacticus]
MPINTPAPPADAACRFLTEAAGEGGLSESSLAYLIDRPGQGPLAWLKPEFRWPDVISPEEWARFSQEANRGLHGKGRFVLTCALCGPDAGPVTACVSGRLVRDSQGKPSWVEGAVRLHREVDDSPEALARSELRAKELAKNIVAVVGHDIRSPLIGVIGMLQLLRKSGLDPRQEEYATAASEACERILEMAKNILDFARIDSGKDELRLAPADMPAVVDSVVALHREQARRASIALVVEVEPDFPRTVLTDEIKLRQILGNLVSNAVKFAPGGEVHVSLSHAPLGRGRVAALLEVTDTGPGFDIAKAGMLFDQFAQLCRDPSHGRHGAGLGLAIVKALADLFGGSVCASSQEGEGATFHVALPILVLSGDSCLMG